MRAQTAKRPTLPSDSASGHHLSWPLVIIILFAIIMLAWGGSLANGFVWDDEWLILDNENLSLSRLPQLLAHTTGVSLEAGKVAYYRPMLALSLLLDTLFWGRSPAGFHATNLVLHLAVALLVFGIARRLLPEAAESEWAALLAAGLFTVLPAHVEPVAYISGRNDSLAGAFSLLALLFYLRSGALPGLASAGFTFLALLSKESAFLMPLALFLIDLLPARRAERWAVKALRWGGQVMATGVFLVLRAVVLGQALSRSPMQLPVSRWLLTVPTASLFYMKALIWPGLSTNHEAEIAPVGSPFDPRFVVGLLTLGALLSLAIKLYRKAPSSGAGLVLAGVSGLIFPAIFPLFATLEVPFPGCERFLYVPSAGLAIALSFLLLQLLRWAGAAWPVPNRWIVSCLSIGVAALLWSGCSETRATDWRSQGTLFETLVRRSPRSSKVHYNLALVYQRENRLREALSEYEEAVRLAPVNFTARNNLGLLYFRFGRTADAEQQYRAALTLEPSQPQILFNLAILLQYQGRLPEAAATYRKAIAKDPLLVDAHIHLGEALWQEGDLSGGLTSYREAVRLGPQNGEAHARYGAALAATGHMVEGIAEMRKGLELDPGDDHVRNDLGAVLTDAGRPQEALRLLEESMARWPQNPRVHYNRGNALRALGRKDEAAAAYRKAIGLSPDYASAYKNLGVVLFELGLKEQALDSFDHLVQLEPASAPAHNNRGVVLRALGRSKEARAEFETAAGLDPRFPEPSRHLREMGVAAPLSGERS